MKTSYNKQMQTSFFPIMIDDQLLPDKAHALAQQLNLPLISSSDIEKNTPLMKLGWWQDVKKSGDDIDETNYKLALFPPNTGPVSIDFVTGKKNHRRQFGGGKGQPLARAVLAAEQPKIVDATAGMGGDAFVFASLGCEVTMIERSPIIAALLQDALKRAQQNETPEEIHKIVNRLSLINEDAAQYLTTQKPACDVIYLDPMYPEKKKTAATKKEMQALQHLVGPDMDSETLLDAALHIAQKRVVVKRPKNAPTLGGIQPNAAIQSPNTRYDIYAIKALKAAGKL
ncbi:class I SAM-dependent methyltransferase [Hydrogenovibrio sp. 3SP14C1]|uniref:class I SAM-dependent methyltransferase n=1 Tax=Hydrogenovibrio sp. 3SP14C1 TaxID=3038774 RepID=UPI0024163C52|nr:class I SAM-dependent methyltransferase [Hydrogenovibrio sp. 3SP14C1]MDG4811417.1 class I SAM-dependent methyltransferase [Hydrogenovibrio sp. 3SP14C1]